MAMPPGITSVRLRLKLRGMPEYGSPWLIKINGKAVLSGSIAADKELWAEIDDVHTPADGILDLHVMGERHQTLWVNEGPAEYDAIVSIGVCGFYLYDSDEDMPAGLTAGQEG